jgi:hypothetical protein
LSHLREMAGVYVAAGHSVWGILNAPATGEAMADLIVHGSARNVDLSPFDPARLRPLDRKHSARPHELFDTEPFGVARFLEFAAQVLYRRHVTVTRVPMGTRG